MYTCRFSSVLPPDQTALMEMMSIEWRIRTLTLTQPDGINAYAFNILNTYGPPVAAITRLAISPECFPAHV